MSYNTVLQPHSEHAYYIANLIAVWNTIEDLLSKILALTLKCSTGKSEAIFLSITGNRAKLMMVDAVAQIGILDSVIQEEFHTLIIKLEKQLKYRNTLAHGLYGTDEKERLNLVNRKYDTFEDQKGASILNISELKTHWVTASENFNCILKIHTDITKSYAKKGEDLTFLSEKFQNWKRDFKTD